MKATEFLEEVLFEAKRLRLERREPITDRDGQLLASESRRICVEICERHRQGQAPGSAMSNADARAIYAAVLRRSLEIVESE